MDTFDRRGSTLTCRQWLLDPAGCSDQQCVYQHAITGFVSPPSMFACYAFNHGGCKFPQDRCLFSHLFAGPRFRYTQMQHPEMSTRDLHIAEAAAQAGFDCSSWAKLKRLLNAIHSATAPVKYPDRWTGSGAFKSGIYPSRWVADYKDAERSTSVPASVPPVDEILRRINDLTHPQSRQRVSFTFTGGTGQNRQPLGERSTNKRTAEAVAGQTPSKNKRTKTNTTASPAIEGSSQANAIDLTSEAPAVTIFNPQRPGPRLHYRNITRIFNTRRPHVSREQLIQGETTGIIAKIASKLRASQHALQIDRETLRNRWDVDEHLQLVHVTDQLAELNRHFSMAEEAIEDSLAVIEQKLLK
ncbi:hypothetical protein JMJ35_002981 [Cladonia borealis]|uniref:C3H1-type domain-containing protein n=1 Tax=Cladonia borealis TaxID=184061 RepID=A0AA39V6K1_9LECA|nr:hypothetical protein JMJ35_002981 [Cladonia borealis]